MAVIEAIQTVRTETEPSYITFSSIPQTYEHLVLRASMTSTDPADAYMGVYIQVGSGGSVDTGSRYTYSAMGANASAQTSEVSALTTQSRFRYVGAAGSPNANQGKSGAFEATFYDYTNTDKNKSWIYFLGWNGPSTGYFYSKYQVSNWVDSTFSHAGIDTIKLWPVGTWPSFSSEFQRNSVISLYGINSS